MKSHRRRVACFMFALFLWQCIGKPTQLEWILTLHLELGLLVALILSYTGRGKGTQWRG